MTPDPVSVFGSLLGGCISDRYLPKDRAGAVEGALFLFLGVFSSVATTLFLSATGILV